MGNTTSGSGTSVPDPHYIDDLVADLERAAARLWRLRRAERRDHPSTPAAINVALDDIADTVARLRDLL